MQAVFIIDHDIGVGYNPQAFEVEKGEESTQGNLNPRRPASTIPESRQAVHESDKTVT
ncbi:MAG: hypothetical protein WCJ37_03520 [Syntrophus sp. (in: bacteria)]